MVPDRRRPPGALFGVTGVTHPRAHGRGMFDGDRTFGNAMTTTLETTATGISEHGLRAPLVDPRGLVRQPRLDRVGEREPERGVADARQRPARESSSLQWIVDAYSLVFAGLLLTAGSLGDRYGRRLALNGGLTIFGLASAFAVFSNSASRADRGRARRWASAPRSSCRRRCRCSRTSSRPTSGPKAIGVWAAFAGIGVALGGVISGWLLQHFWWGSIFLINVFVVIVAMVAGYYLIPRAREAARHARPGRCGLVDPADWAR